MLKTVHIRELYVKKIKKNVKDRAHSWTLREKDIKKMLKTVHIRELYMKKIKKNVTDRTYSWTLHEKD